MTYLERDLRRISDIGNLAEFARLMQLGASSTGCILNQANLARDEGISPATAGRHLSILEASFLLTRLPPFFVNIGKRMVKAPKLFWNDTGLATHLCGISSVEALRADPRMLGRLMATLVMMEVQSCPWPQIRLNSFMSARTLGWRSMASLPSGTVICHSRVKPRKRSLRPMPLRSNAGSP